MRLTIAQARALGARINQQLVDEVESGRAPQTLARATEKANAKPSTNSAPAAPSEHQPLQGVKLAPSRNGSGASDPREILFAALQARFGNYADDNPGGVAREVGGVLAGRRFRLDFALVDRRIAIELDGFQFHRDKKSYGRDRERSRKLFAAGWETIRVTAGQVFNGVDQVLDDIESGIKYRQSRGFIPFRVAPAGWILLGPKHHPAAEVD